MRVPHVVKATGAGLGPADGIEGGGGKNVAAASSAATRDVRLATVEMRSATVVLVPATRTLDAVSSPVHDTSPVVAAMTTRACGVASPAVVERVTATVRDVKAAIDSMRLWYPTHQQMRLVPKSGRLSHRALEPQHRTHHQS